MYLNQKKVKKLQKTILDEIIIESLKNLILLVFVWAVIVLICYLTKSE